MLLLLCFYQTLFLNPFFSAMHTANIMYGIYLGLLEDGAVILSGPTTLGIYLYNTISCMILFFFKFYLLLFY